MKLYHQDGAPNPRRVKIFAAEKGIDLELVSVAMLKREHKTPEFLAKNPSGKIPVLELDDGRCIPESVAICRYLEAVEPEPNLLLTISMALMSLCFPLGMFLPTNNADCLALGMSIK